ncbi:MAG: hypothetical protein JNN20_07295 [Betaproteobacteria bacterium]|nr:hypothetical protein [Betaproteobacteria bacterium]
MNYRYIFAILALTVAPAVAFAQAPAAEVAKHSCTKPPLPDAAKKLTAQEKNAIIASMEVFRNCVFKFSDEQQKQMLAKQKEAEALAVQVKTANAAILASKAAVDGAVDDYNQFSQAATKIVQKDDAKKTGTNEAPAARPSKSY